MLDGISSNQKDKAFQILYNMLHSGSDPFSIIGAIVSQFELMLSVRQLREDGLDLSAMHKKLGSSEYRIKKLIPYASKYSVEKLKHTFVWYLRSRPKYQDWTARRSVGLRNVYCKYLR